MLKHNYFFGALSSAFVAIFMLGCSGGGSKPTVGISGNLPPVGRVGTIYGPATLVASGGNDSYIWSTNDLPPGVAVQGATNGSSLVIGGTPTAAGTYMTSLTLADGNGHTAIYSVSITISAPGALSVTTTGLPVGTVATAYTGQLAATGGKRPYTWSETSGGALPTGLMLTTSTGMIAGSPTNAGAFGPYVFTVTDANGATAASGNLSISVRDSSASVCTPLGNEAMLTPSTPFAFLLQGNDANIEGVAAVGSFTPNGDGKLVAADIDYNGVDLSGGQHLAVNLAASSYSLGADGRGCLFLAFSGSPEEATPKAKSVGVFRFQHTAGRRKRTAKASPQGATNPLSSLRFSFALSSKNVSNVYQIGRIMEFNPDMPVSIASGPMHVQDPSSFARSALKSKYAFGIEGWDPEDFRLAIAGTFANSSGTLSMGVADINDGGDASGELTGASGQIDSSFSATSGRGTGSYSIPLSAGGTLTYDFALYMINATDFFIISTDVVSDVALLSGRAMQSNASFSSAALNAYYLLALDGFDGDVGANFVEIGALQAASSNAVPGVTLFVNDAGDAEEFKFSNAKYSVDRAAGRMSFSNEFPDAPVVYLTSLGATGERIAGFLVGTDNFAAGGFLVTQSAQKTDFTLGSVSGPYGLGTAEDVTGVEESFTGVTTFSGTGQYSEILDSHPFGNPSYGNLTQTGTLTVESDGTGIFDGGFGALVTNGNRVYAIDISAQPLLYIFDIGVLPE